MQTYRSKAIQSVSNKYELVALLVTVYRYRIGITIVLS